VVRTFLADPGKHAFPNESLLTYLCVRVTTEQGPVWLDGIVRNAPFGELPEMSQGREAYVLPRPGQSVERVTTPVATQAVTKESRLVAELTADGTLSGTGTETYTGFGAAQLQEAFDSLNAEQRQQALQQALSRTYGGAEMMSLKVETGKGTGQPLTIRFSFRAPRFARVDGSTLVVPALAAPEQLGRRYVQLASRNTPLLIDPSSRAHSVVTLKVPAGAVPTGLVPSMVSTTSGARYARQETFAQGLLTVDESFTLSQVRVQPKAYADFARFCGEVDLAQARDAVIRLR
jgi:cellulose synthase operon protein C